MSIKEAKKQKKRNDGIFFKSRFISHYGCKEYFDHKKEIKAQLKTLKEKLSSYEAQLEKIKKNPSV